MNNRVFVRTDLSRDKYRSSVPIDATPFPIQDQYVATEGAITHTFGKEALYNRHSESLKR